MIDFSSNLAERFSSISDVTRLSQTESPLTQLSRGDLSSIISRPPIDFGPIISRPPSTSPPSTSPPTAPPLTPGDAGTFLGIVAQTPQQIIAAAVHAARLAFEAIPAAENGDVIDASIPNGFRSALITLLSLADATVQRLVQPPRPIPVGPPRPLPVDTGFLHIDPSLLATVAPQPPSGQPAATAPATPAAPGTSPAPAAAPSQPSLPSLDLGGRVFEPQTVTHPETGTTTTVFVERPAETTVSAATLSPVSGGGFHLLPTPTLSGSLGIG